MQKSAADVARVSTSFLICLLKCSVLAQQKNDIYIYILYININKLCIDSDIDVTLYHVSRIP